MNTPGTAEPPHDALVDARGLRCPAPVIRLARAARDVPPGTVLTVWWTDPAAQHDIPAWARMRGHEVLTTTDLDPQDPPARATRVRIRAADMREGRPTLSGGPQRS